MDAATIAKYIFFAFFAFFAGLIYYALTLEKRRTKALKKLAGKKGYSFIEKGTEQLPLMNISRTAKNASYGNIISGDLNGIAFKMYDYEYQTNMGNKSKVYSQTIIAMPKEILDFSLSRESALDRFIPMVSQMDIDFQEYPEFSKKFRLIASDKTAIKNIFTKEVVDKLLALPQRFALEVREGTMYYYVPSYPMQQKDFDNYLDQGTKTLAIFQSKVF